MHVRTRYDLYTRTAHQDQNYVQSTSYKTTGFACLYPHTNHTPRPARAERPQAARPPSVQLLCDRVGPDHVVVEDVLAGSGRTAHGGVPAGPLTAQTRQGRNRRAE